MRPPRYRSPAMRQIVKEHRTTFRTWHPACPVCLWDRSHPARRTPDASPRGVGTDYRVLIHPGGQTSTTYTF